MRTLYLRVFTSRGHAAGSENLRALHTPLTALRLKSGLGPPAVSARVLKKERSDAANELSGA